MKLTKLFEGPSTYMSGGQRYGAWEEPGDQPESDDTTQVMTIPYTTAGGSEVQLKVSVSYYDDGRQVEVTNVSPQAVVLPSGKEVDMEVAAQQLSSDGFDQDFGQQDVSDTVEEYLYSTLKKSIHMPAIQATQSVAQAAPVASKVPAMHEALEGKVVSGVNDPMPKEAPKPGMKWIRMKGGPQDGQWVQVKKY